MILKLEDFTGLYIFTGKRQKADRSSHLTDLRTILHIPCISFIVVLFNILAVLYLDDLIRLENFTRSISNGRTEAFRRLHTLCQNFWRVASLYIEARQAENSISDLPGLPMSVSELSRAISFNLDLNIMMDSDLGDWFTVRRSVMGLLDHTFSA